MPAATRKLPPTAKEAGRLPSADGSRAAKMQSGWGKKSGARVIRRIPARWETIADEESSQSRAGKFQRLPHTDDSRAPRWQPQSAATGKMPFCIFECG